MNYCVYKHTCPNGKVYIGITGQNPIKRWKNGAGYYHNKHFYRAILKYGWDNIKHEILYSELTKEEACEKEIELITLYKSNYSNYGYNICNGGEINLFSEEFKKNRSKKYSGKGNPRARMVINIDTNQMFGTVTLAAKSVKGTRTGISRACNGCNATHKGYRWRYVDE